jgi:hypothetical protein
MAAHTAAGLALNCVFSELSVTFAIAGYYNVFYGNVFPILAVKLIQQG